MSQFDGNEYKEKERRGWDDAASGWEKWWEVFESGGRAITDRMIELAGVGPGDRVLDIATGIGEPGLSAASVVGSNGHVTMTDLSSGMLAVAEERAKSQGFGHVDFRVTDAESLDVAGSFDAVLCRWGLMFFPDLETSSARIRSVLNPGGRLVAAVWGPPDRCPIISVPVMTIMKTLQLQPPPPGTPGIFALADPTPLERALSQAGLEAVTIERFPVVFGFEGADQYINFMKDVASPIKMLMADQSPERQEEIWSLTKQAVASLADADGRLSAPNESILVRAVARGS